MEELIQSKGSPGSQPAGSVQFSQDPAPAPGSSREKKSPLFQWAPEKALPPDYGFEDDMKGMKGDPTGLFGM